MPDVMMPIQRPNGKLYRPRRIIAYEVSGEWDTTVGVIVLGTHDQLRAKVLADRVAQRVESGCVAVDPLPGWYRDGFEWGQRAWVSDEVHGRAGVWFREIVEATFNG